MLLNPMLSYLQEDKYQSFVEASTNKLFALNMSLELSLVLSKFGQATFSDLEICYPISCVISESFETNSKLIYLGYIVNILNQ